MAHAGNLIAARYHKGNVPAIITNHSFGAPDNLIFVEVGQTLPGRVFRVKLQFPQVDVTSGIKIVMPAAFHKCIFSVGKYAFRFIILFSSTISPKRLDGKNSPLAFSGAFALSLQPPF